MPLTALIPLAHAATLTLAGGAETGINDPYVLRHGVRAAVAVAPVEWFELGAAAAAYPDFGSADYTAAVRDLRERGIAPDVSRIMSMTQLQGGLMPLHSALGGVDTRVGAYGGVGFVWTHDDLVLIRQEDSPDFMATERERHLAAVLGLRGEATFDKLLAQLRIEVLGYQETVATDIIERRWPIFLGVDVGWRFDDTDNNGRGDE